jgi:hypothetical protein
MEKNKCSSSQRFLSKCFCFFEGAKIGNPEEDYGFILSGFAGFIFLPGNAYTHVFAGRLEVVSVSIL